MTRFGPPAGRYPAGGTPHRTRPNHQGETVTTYRIEFGMVGDARPVPPLTLDADDRAAIHRAVAEYAIPHLRPVLAEMGRPELADCFFRTNKDRTLGEFMWISFDAGKGARFCPARITTTTPKES